MKKFIKKSLIMMVLSVQIAPAFAGSNDYKPSHGGYSGVPQARRVTNLSDLPEELHREIAKFLSPSSFGAFVSSCKNVAPLGRDPIVGFRAAKNGTPVYDLQGNISYTDKVSHAFADLGKMHKVAGLIWSGVAPQTMNQRDAVAYCAGLGGGARLPTKEEYAVLSRAMGSRQPLYDDGYGNQRADYDVAGYDRNLISDVSNRWFWSASADPNYVDLDLAFFFTGLDGDVNRLGRRDGGLWVQCVVGG